MLVIDIVLLLQSCCRTIIKSVLAGFFPCVKSFYFIS